MRGTSKTRLGNLQRHRRFCADPSDGAKDSTSLHRTTMILGGTLAGRVFRKPIDMPILFLFVCIHAPHVPGSYPFVFRVTLRPAPMPRLPRTCVFVLSFHHVHGHGRVGIESRSSTSTLLPLATRLGSAGIRPRLRPCLGTRFVRASFLWGKEGGGRPQRFSMVGSERP